MHPFKIENAGVCAVCDTAGEFKVAGGSIREDYRCRHCDASLRYRQQAAALVGIYGNSQIASLAGLITETSFARLHIYEPGIIGPFRSLLKRLPHYTQSYYWPGVESGEKHQGVRCENLERLTFADGTFDLVLTSDIFEHVRRPMAAFAELHRVLKPGGRHCFTVPLTWPLPAKTQTRVDTATDTDVPLLPPVYHLSPTDLNGSLVYTDFGLDLLDHLRELGFETEYTYLGYNVTFCSRVRS